MGELTFDGIQFLINGKPLSDGVLSCSHIAKSEVTIDVRLAKLKSEMDAMAEKYKPIADGLVREIYERPQIVLSPTTTLTTHEPRKHYKPKFTL